MFFPSGSVVKNMTASAGEAGSVPRSRRCPGEGNGNPLLYACLENSHGQRNLRATVHRIAKESNTTQATKQQSSSYRVVPKSAAPASRNLSEMQVQTYWVRNSRGGAPETVYSKPSGDSGECLDSKQPHPILIHFLNDRSTQITGQ